MKNGFNNGLILAGEYLRSDDALLLLANEIPDFGQYQFIDFDTGSARKLGLINGGEVRPIETISIPEDITERLESLDGVAQSRLDKLEDLRDQAFLERDELAIKAKSAGLITFEEALAWAAGNSIPADIVTAIDAIENETERENATIAASSALRFGRNSSVIKAFAAMRSIPVGDLDLLFDVAQTGA